MLTLDIIIFPVQEGHFHFTRGFEQLPASVDQGEEAIGHARHPQNDRSGHRTQRMGARRLTVSDLRRPAHSPVASKTNHPPPTFLKRFEPSPRLPPTLSETAQTRSLTCVALDTLCSGGSHGSTGTRSSTPIQTGASGSDPGRGTGSDQHLRQARRASNPHACTAARNR